MLRDLGQSILTADSSHFSSISTAPPSITSDTIQFVKAREDFRIAVWRATVPAAGHDTCLQQSSETISNTDSTISAENYDGWSGAWSPAEKSAMRSRAWAKERARRDGRIFSRRKRWKTDDVESVRGPARVQRDRDGKVQLRHLTGDRRGKWPEGSLPILRKIGDQKSFSSDVTDFVV